MNIVLLASGGDAPGMNSCLYEICRHLKKHKLFASLYGFKGLIENQIIKVDIKKLKDERKKAGVLFKTSRCDEFKTDDGFKTALKNLKQNHIDIVIILGGDGSFKGGQKLVKHGVEVIFVPATIDNDMPYQTNCIGFDTAVYACVNYIKNVMPSMKAFDRSCVFEVMGRNNPSICNKCGELLKAELVISNPKDKLEIKKINKSNIVVLQENLFNKEDVAKKLEERYNITFKSACVGYLQRGTSPTNEEIKLCKKYANLVEKAIKTKSFSCALKISNQDMTIELFN